MMGERTGLQESLLYSFSLEGHVPQDHLLRSIDRFVDLGAIREHLRPYYSETGRPSIDPELMVRMLIVGYCMGIRSERRLCEEVLLNLAYRWFCRLGLGGCVPDHSTFSKNRHGRFRDSDLLRELFEECRENQVQGVLGPIAGRVMDWAKRIGLDDYQEVRFGDKFLPEGLVLPNGAPSTLVSLDEESYGTGEQLSLLARPPGSRRHPGQGRARRGRAR